jgi:hypothetical protein
MAREQNRKLRETIILSAKALAMPAVFEPATLKVKKGAAYPDLSQWRALPLRWPRPPSPVFIGPAHVQP